MATNQLPFPVIQVNNDPDLSSVLTQNFQNMKVAGTNILNNSITASQLSQVYTDADSRVVYGPSVSNWSVKTASLSAPAGYVAGYNNQYHYTNTAGAFLQLSIKTSAFNLYCIKGPSCGQVNVAIDGGTPTLVDLYASSYIVSNVYNTTLELTQHTILVTLQNTKNASSSGYDLDFICLGDGTQLTDKNILPNGLGVSTGNLAANSGNIGGWTINASTIVSPNGRITLDSANNKIQMSDGSNIRILFQT